MRRLELSQVQVANLNMLILVAECVKRDHAIACSRFGLDAEQAGFLASLPFQEMLTLITHLGDECLFPPRSDLIQVLACPPQLAGALLIARPVRPARANTLVSPGPAEKYGGAMKTERNLLHAQRHIQALALATECAQLGARIRTIQLLTGLSATQLHHLFRHPLGGPRRGRHPDSREWYHSANLLYRTEASIVAVLFRRLAARGIDPPFALIGAYRHYLDFCKAAPRITFDRAFDLVAHTTGRWLAAGKSFSVFACPACRSEYLTGVSLAPRSNHECPFCKLLDRYTKDPRIQAAFPRQAPGRDIQTFWISACWSKSLASGLASGPAPPTLNSP